jgi:hypothetical protein
LDDDDFRAHRIVEFLRKSGARDLEEAMQNSAGIREP